MALQGQTQKNSYYQAGRIVKAMREHDQEKGTQLTATNEFIELVGHIKLIDLCEEAARLPTLPVPRQTELLGIIAASVDPLPMSFKVTILVAFVQRLKWTNVADVEAWIAMANPFPLEGYSL